MTEKFTATLLMIIADPTTRQTIEQLLDGTGFNLYFAETAAAGLRKAVELLPTVIVLDIDPQRLNSYETCRRLQANHLLDGVPIVMLCDRSDRDTRAAGLSAGADDFLDKPLDGLELLARLRTLTRLNTYRHLLTDLTRFSWMVEHAHEGYLMLDQSGSIHYANERALNILNLPEDFIGLPFTNVVERQYLPQPTEAWQNWLNDPAPCFLIQPEGPTARAVWMVLEALDTPLGTEYQRIVRLRDVTERMSIYQDMRKFHTTIAHKLRTPMSMLITSISIIKDQLDNLSPEELKMLLASTIKGTDRLAEEVRGILTYIDAPLALNVGEPVAVGELIDIGQLLGAQLNIKDVLISVPDELRESLIALTPDALEMILHELLENARKFHPTQSPRVEISVGKDEAGFIRMRISDDGLTLSTEQLDWAWLPYFQSEKSFTGEVPGLGLGFPMVATLVWKAGGTLHLRNRQDGPGVVVDIKIPLESTMRKMERSAVPYGS